jgi:hypothetical protein
MKRKSIYLLTLGIIAALVLSPMIVQAAEGSQMGPKGTDEKPSASKPWAHQFTNKFQTKLKQRIETMYNQLKNGKLWNWRNRQKLEPKFTDEAELPDLEDIDVDGLIDEYEGLLDAEDELKGRTWLLVANGRSWEIVNEPETNEVAPEDCTRMWMRLGIRKVIADDGTIVFRVVRGVVIHGEEKTQVTGAGVLRKDGIFAMRLRGEGLRLKAVGRAFKMRYSYFVLMKGRMNLDGGGEYAFLLKGRAYRLRHFRPRITASPEDTAESVIPS